MIRDHISAERQPLSLEALNPEHSLRYARLLRNLDASLSCVLKCAQGAGRRIGIGIETKLG